LWSLAFLLFATGGNPKLIELVMSRYRARIQLDAAELELLPNALRARPLLLDAWAVGHGLQSATQAVKALPGARRDAAAIARAVRGT
jgi:Ser/Thr protein kinase RdoA (MazF antagonist)